MTWTESFESESTTAEMTGEEGSGVEAGDSAWLPIATTGEGEDLADALGVVPLDASPRINEARRRSSRVVFLGELAEFGLLAPGLAERLVPKDFRRFDRAESAN